MVWLATRAAIVASASLIIAHILLNPKLSYDSYRATSKFLFAEIYKEKYYFVLQLL